MRVTENCHRECTCSSAMLARKMICVHMQQIPSQLSASRCHELCSSSSCNTNGKMLSWQMTNCSNSIGISGWGVTMVNCMKWALFTTLTYHVNHDPAIRGYVGHRMVLSWNNHLVHTYDKINHVVHDAECHYWWGLASVNNSNKHRCLLVVLLY